MEGGPIGKMDIQPLIAPGNYPAGVQNEIPYRALPKALFPYYSLDLIKDPEISIEEKLNLVKAYGKNSKDWLPPKSARSREFVLDMSIFLLEDARNNKVGTMVNI